MEVSAQNVSTFAFQFSDKIREGVPGVSADDEMYVVALAVEFQKLRTHLFTGFPEDAFDGRQDPVGEDGSTVFCHKD
jgi:hypothetical protein